MSPSVPRPGRSASARGRRRARRRAGSRSDARRDVLVGLLVAAGLAAAIVLSTVAINGNPLSDPYRLRVAVPAGSPALKPGDEVRIAGRRAGTVRTVDPGPKGGPLVGFDVDDGPLGAGTTAQVRLRGVAGAVYVELRPGDADRPLRSGTRLASTAGATTQLGDVVGAFDSRARSGLRRSLTGLGLGLADRGETLRGTITDLAPTADHVTRLGGAALGGDGGRGTLARLVGDAGRTLRALDAGGALATTVPAARRAVEALPPGDLGRVVDAVPPAQAAVRRSLPGVEGLLDDLDDATGTLRPAVADVRRAMPAVNALLARNRGVRFLGALGGKATPVVRQALPVLKDARDPASLVRPASEPLGLISSYMAPYRRDMVGAVAGFTRWGDFTYGDGQAQGARAVRFTLVLTCHFARTPYPAPSAAEKERRQCRR